MLEKNAKPQLRTFSNEPIRIEGKIQYPVSSNGWNSRSATFAVVDDSLKSLFGRHLFDQLGLAATEPHSYTGSQVNTISPHSELKEHIASQFPNKISRIGRQKNNVAKSKFHKTFQPRYQKGRRMPNILQDKVNNELKKLLANCPDENFYLPNCGHCLKRSVNQTCPWVKKIKQSNSQKQISDVRY